ncbi:MAG TPA: DUF2911 domain-containing protein [Longimicrobiales bacterium]|nr:DUF2911 domain-containing protein [Longimicrobiales bacterium]
MRIAAMSAVVASAACMSSAPATEQAGGSGQLATDPVVPLECQPALRADGSVRMALAGRPSPFDSADVRVGNQTIRVCYGRPGVKDRAIYGGLVPYDTLWRTGANEPTILHVPFTAEIAGLRVPPGSYSLYTVPGAGDWTIVINRSTSQWGHESSYSPEVRAQELGRARVRTERLDQHVELFTIRGQPAGQGADILLEWERTRVRIPARVAPPG